MNEPKPSPGTLSESQRALLAARLRQGRAKIADGITRRDPGVTNLPLSFGQEQLWFIDQFAPGTSLYNLAGAIRLRGPLDQGALGRAVEAFAARHEALRTRFAVQDGVPRQLIDPPAARPLPLEDLGTVPGAERERALREHLTHEANRPFDLAAGPLFRCRLVRLDEREHVLLHNFHHTVFDGWSVGVLLRELPALYLEQAGGAGADLPELPVQFADYALWERERLQGEQLEKLVGYWRETLGGLDTVQMPTDRPRPLLQSFDGGIARLPMGRAVLQGLRALARSEGTTLYVAVLAAVQTLLHRYSGQDDVVIGTASANRSRPELSAMVGYLVNTLPIRTGFTGDPAFREVLRAVHTANVEAYAHQELPFAKLVDALKVERDASRAPIFQIGFTLAEEGGEPTVTGELTWTDEDLTDLITPAKFDLNFFPQVLGGELVVDLSYPTALYDAATAERLLGNLRVLLDAVVADADADRPVSALPLLSKRERELELREWNDTDAEYPVMCVHERFEQQVRATPDAIAADCEGERLTYAELNADANRIARHLREHGAGVERLVGVSMKPSLRRLAALLGIMKAGGGYVPLDPDLPAERLAYMIGDARMPAIVTDTQSVGSLPQTEAHVIDLDAAWKHIGTLEETDPESGAAPGNTVYVIYTSGSTGRPKGVVLEHAPVVNFVEGMVRRWHLGVDDNVLQFASLNFDVSVMDMFLALCSGATAVLGSRETLLSPPRLADLMRERKVTFTCLPPAVVSLLTGEPLPDLRVLISAGEALPSELLRGWLNPGLSFCNGYGPTEAAIGATLMVLDGTTFPPPIGKPMPNYRAYVLDRKLNPVPVGVVGELHLGGACVARGYLNQPELTEQRFIPDPYSGKPGARLYKTGDLVKRLPSGDIQFVGRIDGQVKIRGLRVELGEIETALAAHPSVAQAAVIVADDAAGQKQLIGYVRAEPGAIPAPAADLRQHLSRRLPAYMVPAHIVALETFPLTPNGKLDVKALPSPESVEREYRAPSTLIETILVDFYAGLLKAPRVGVDESFFDLGGNSLQAMQLISRLRSELAVDTDVTAIFLAPTAAQLAALLREKYGFEDAELGEGGLDELDLAAD